MQTASKQDQNWEEIKENLQNSYTDNRMTDIQSVVWEREIRNSQKKDSFIYISFDERSAAEFDHQQSYLDNIIYQCENFEESCKELEIKNLQIVWLSEMPHSIQLKKWQMIDITAIHHFRESWLWDCMLADSVNLRKTFTILTYILHVSDDL